MFLWKDIKESEKVDKEKIKEELADVLAFCFLLANKHGFDVRKIVLEKMKTNGKKYPVRKSERDCEEIQ